MKYNLKNRPTFDINKKENRELVLWFEGFEAELRKALKEDISEYSDCRAWIKEILGES